MKESYFRRTKCCLRGMLYPPLKFPPVLGGTTRKEATWNRKSHLANRMFSETLLIAQR